MILWMRIAFLGVLIGLIGCQTQPPTKSFDQQAVKEKAGIVLTEKTVIIDARPPFEYSMAHLNGSMNMRWDEFTQRDVPYKGLLEVDLFFLSRRLARYGIAATTPVVVVGRGLQGDGEEGRLAWTLKVLGIQDVHFASLDSFSLSLTKDEAPPKPAAVIWKPIVDDSLRVDRNTFLNAAMSKDAKRAQYAIIDVRSEAEYLGKDTRSPYANTAPDLGAINIPWNQFFNADDSVKVSMATQLEQVGIDKDKTIYVIDNLGVRSAAVCLALRDLGFSKSANFAGGYMELLGTRH
jgi:thiosulfate/3-mercaptopyruvate sulfurtransferase